MIIMLYYIILCHIGGAVRSAALALGVLQLRLDEVAGVLQGLLSLLFLYISISLSLSIYIYIHLYISCYYVLYLFVWFLLCLWFPFYVFVGVLRGLSLGPVFKKFDNDNDSNTNHDSTTTTTTATTATTSTTATTNKSLDEVAGVLQGLSAGRTTASFLNLGKWACIYSNHTLLYSTPLYCNISSHRISYHIIA